MDINEAKLSVIEAGHKLVSNGLIARTWGNVSCRVSDTQFVITPSGRDYMSLTPDEIVAVNIADCSYDGDVKPSSEKGVHAECYKLRPDCNFVIHTHQTYASVMGVLGFDINNIPEASRAIIGDCVPAASYGLPGTGKLRNGVSEALKRSTSKALLMTHHGAVCLGADEDEAFRVANELEKVCLNCLFTRYEAMTGETAKDIASFGAYISDKFTAKKSDRREYPAYTSQVEGDTMVMYPADKDGDMVRVELLTGEPVCLACDLPETSELHRQIYLNRPEVNCIIHSKSPDEVEASKLGITFKPILDDFAQIVGVTMRTADFNPSNTMKTAKKTVKKLKGRSAVLVRNNGVVCVAGDLSDAEAVEMVADKGCKAYIGSQLYGGAKPIKLIECALMRLVYTKKYSKQK